MRDMPRNWSKTHSGNQKRQLSVVEPQAVSSGGLEPKKNSAESSRQSRPCITAAEMGACFMLPAA